MPRITGACSKERLPSQKRTERFLGVAETAQIALISNTTTRGMGGNQRFTQPRKYLCCRSRFRWGVDLDFGEG